MGGVCLVVAGHPLDTIKVYIYMMWWLTTAELIRAILSSVYKCQLLLELYRTSSPV
jgi:hypothetical protein